MAPQQLNEFRLVIATDSQQLLLPSSFVGGVVRDLLLGPETLPQGPETLLQGPVKGLAFPEYSIRQSKSVDIFVSRTHNVYNVHGGSCLQNHQPSSHISPSFTLL